MSFKLEINRWEQVMSLLANRDERSISDLNREAVMTYSHMIKIMNELFLKELINKRKEGREHIITLTAKGRKIADCCNFIDNYLMGGRK